MKFRKKKSQMNYSVYQPCFREWLQYAAEGTILCILLDYLFYKSIASFLFLLPLVFFYMRERRRGKTRALKTRLREQFRDALNSMQVGISAGYSAENAVKEARSDLERIHGKKAELTLEFIHIERSLSQGRTLEELLTDLGMRSGIEDILNFSQILIQSKRMGGNMGKVLDGCILSLEEQMDVKKEIQGMLAARTLEQKIMSVIPLGTDLYLQTTSAQLLSVMYGNPAGICVMSGCLGLYLGAYVWGARIVEIEV